MLALLRRATLGEEAQIRAYHDPLCGQCLGCEARALLSGQPVATEAERLETALYEISEAAAQPEGYYTDETEAVLKEVLPRVENRALFSGQPADTEEAKP